MILTHEAEPRGLRFAFDGLELSRCLLAAFRTLGPFHPHVGEHRDLLCAADLAPSFLVQRI